MITAGIPVLPLEYGTLAIEGDLLVAHLGNRHFTKDIAVRLAEAELKVQGRWMDINRNGEAVEAVMLPKRPGPVKEFLVAFEEARALAVRREPPPAGVAVGRCDHCGAPGKRSDRSCRYCGF